MQFTTFTMHGECNKAVTCRNYAGNHCSTYKNCPVVLKNKEIKMIMAYNNISFRKAERLINNSFSNQETTSYDRYTNPTRISRNNRK